MADWVQYVRQRLRLPWLTPAREAEIVEDLARQLEDCYCEALARGISEQEAAAYAREQIPNWESFAAELCQAERRNAQPSLENWYDRAEQATSKGGRWTMLADLKRDLLYGIRMLTKNPGFTAVAVLTLALGIGANSTIFSWINTLMLNPFPGVTEQTELVVFTQRTQRGIFSSLSYPNFVDFRDRNTMLTGLIVYDDEPVNLNSEGRSERIWSQLVSANYFTVLGVKPALGRTFLPEESKVPGEAAVIVLSHGFWQRRFGGEESVIGRVVQINSYPYTIVGVADEGFQGTAIGLSFDLWIPLMMQQKVMGGSSRLDARGNSWLAALARLKPGVSLEQAQAELSSISTQLAEEFPQTHRGRPVALFPLWKAPTGAAQMFRLVFIVLSGVVGLVLLIACANVANLLLARSTARRKEIAIRLSLGAGRTRLVRQLLTESLLLALMGGALGILLTHWTSWSLLFLVPPTDAPVAPQLGVSTPVVLFTLGVSALTALLFGLVPALQATRTNLVATLNDESGRSSVGHRKGFLRNALVVAQVSLSLMLLISAALFIRSLQKAQAFNPGFNPQNVLLETTDLFLADYSPDKGRIFYQQLLRAVAALPGVESVSLARRVPLSLDGTSSTSIQVEDYDPDEDEDVFAFYNQVGPDYFRTMQIPLLGGRDFTHHDIKDAPTVVIVNETMAKRYWKDQNPVGRRLRLGEEWATVIGVARDIKYRALNERPLPFMFLSLQQFYRSEATLHVRTTGNPAEMAMAVRDEIQSVDANLPVYRIMSLASATTAATLQHRLGGNLLGIFGLLALVLASVGISGVLAYSVGQRTHEFGIRIALGAQPSDILKLVVRQSLLLVLVGVALGLVGAFALTRFLESLLFGVSAHDPFAFVATPLLLVGVALLACYVPARRATKVDPMVALRYE